MYLSKQRGRPFSTKVDTHIQVVFAGKIKFVEFSFCSETYSAHIPYRTAANDSGTSQTNFKSDNVHSPMKLSNNDALILRNYILQKDCLSAFLLLLLPPFLPFFFSLSFFPFFSGRFTVRRQDVSDVPSGIHILLFRYFSDIIQWLGDRLCSIF